MAHEALTPGPVPLCGSSLADLGRLLEELGQPAFRARQLFRQVYVRGVTDVAAMTDLSKDLRTALADRVVAGVPEIAEVRAAADGTRKVLFRLADGRSVEGVLIPMPRKARPDEPPALTQCISTQVGCTLDCAFCLTGTLGLLRNLTAGEIVGQVLAARAVLGPDEQVGRFVYMGMGEPLANYDAVVTSVRLITDPDGMAVSGRRVTVSTAGMVNRIPDFGRDCRASLAVSLNGTTDAQRQRLMPRVAGRWPLADLMEALRAFEMARRKWMTIEYVLLAGENDSDADARRLARLVKDLRCKVNLIPYNPHPAASFRRPAPDRVRAFQRLLLDANLSTSIRESRGDDVLAACGQLGAMAARRDAADEGGTAVADA